MLSKKRALSFIIPALLLLTAFEFLSDNKIYLTGHSILMGIIHVTDSTNPAFDRKEFTPAHYGTKGNLGEALRKMFPPGTPRQMVNEVLVDTGKANAVRQKDEGVYIYWFTKNEGLFAPPNFCGILQGKWSFTFHFDYSLLDSEANDSLREITWTPAC